MRIALIADDFKVETGTGIARYSRGLLTGLKNRGFYVDPIGLRPLSIPFGEPINHFFRLSYYVLNKVNDFDLAHATAPVTGLSFPFIKKPKIVTYHDLTSLLYKRGCTFHTRLFAPLLLKRIAKYSHKIIAVSTQTKREMITYLQIPEKKITVVNPGVDERLRPTKKRERDYHVIGYIGTLTLRKRVDRLLRAFYWLRRKHPKLKAKLFICGKKSLEYHKLAKLARELKISEDVDFKGFISDEKLVETYNSFDVFVFPGEWEGFYFPALEAQKCGVPVVIREGAQIPLEVSRYCLKAKSDEDIADKVYEILVNSHLKDEIAEKGLEYSKKFTWERATEETLKVYEEVLSVNVK